MTAAIDTNILFDILADDQEFFHPSKSLFDEYCEKGALVISPIVYAELLTFFIRKRGSGARKDLYEFLRASSIRVQNFSGEDLRVAAQAWNEFRKTASLQDVECPSCGRKNKFTCKSCKRKVSWRNHILTDFLIGAHAQNNADVLLTRDAGFYRKYFDLKIASS